MPSDLPEGQQSKLSWSEAIARSKAAFDEVEWRRQTLAEHEAAEMPCCCDEAAVEARVRAEVLRDAAADLLATDVHEDLCSYGPPGTCDCALGEHYRWLLARAGEPVGRLDRVWWLHRCVDSNPALTWFSDLVAADVPRPERCPSCGTAASDDQWLQVAPR
jgi:hypothetical protein